MKRNLLLSLRYVGTRYHGFQVQKNALSVCSVFQDAVEQVFGSRIDIKGCSRTDAGVHANQFCLSMKVEKNIPCDKLVIALNRYLPDDVAVTHCREVPADFHARYSSTGKEYVYKVRNSWIRDPFLTDFVCLWGYPLEVELLHRQAQDFVGQHDFAAFQASGSNVVDTVRTIYSFRVERQGDLVLFTVAGDGFLYKMVRNMVGTLLEIASGHLPQGCIPKILESRDRQQAGKTAPACGLYLNRVFYDLPGWDSYQTNVSSYHND